MASGALPRSPPVRRRLVGPSLVAERRTMRAQTDNKPCGIPLRAASIHLTHGSNVPKFQRCPSGSKQE